MFIDYKLSLKKMVLNLWQESIHMEGNAAQGIDMCTK